MDMVYLEEARSLPALQVTVFRKEKIKRFKKKGLPKMSKHAYHVRENE